MTIISKFLSVTVIFGLARIKTVADFNGNDNIINPKAFAACRSGGYCAYDYWMLVESRISTHV